MTKYISHASIDENGNIIGGIAGDQTGKEVCIRTWYSHPWNYVIRIQNETIRNQFANNMIDCAKNDNIGYDQSERNTILTQAEKVNFDFSKITTKCEGDCSSIITTCILGAIYKVLGKTSYNQAKTVLVVSGNCATTSTLRNRLSKLTMITTLTYNSTSYINGTNNAEFGDIYIKEGSHVVCYINDANKKNINMTSSIAEPTTYTVQKNDTLSTIGAKKGIAWQTIADLNNINPPYVIQIGQVLTLTPQISEENFSVKIIVNNLNIRSGAGTSYRIVGCITDKGTYTITKVSGSWGYLQNGTGWINISSNYAKRV